MEGFKPQRKIEKPEDKVPQLNRREFLAGAAALGAAAVSGESKAAESGWINPDSVPNPDYVPPSEGPPMSEEEAKAMLQEARGLYDEFTQKGGDWLEVGSVSAAWGEGGQEPTDPARKIFREIVTTGRVFHQDYAELQDSIKRKDRVSAEEHMQDLRTWLARLEIEVGVAEKIPGTRELVEKVKGGQFS